MEKNNYKQFRFQIPDDSGDGAVFGTDCDSVGGSFGGFVGISHRITDIRFPEHGDIAVPVSGTDQQPGPCFFFQIPGAGAFVGVQSGDLERVFAVGERIHNTPAVFSDFRRHRVRGIAWDMEVKHNLAHRFPAGLYEAGAGGIRHRKRIRVPVGDNADSGKVVPGSTSAGEKIQCNLPPFFSQRE